MKTLILLRHAKSDWNDPSQKDIDRPLNPRGQRDASAIGKWISKHYMPEHALISSSKRTIETFELSAIQCEHETQKSLYLASDRDMITAVQKVDATISTLMIVGHNPGITDLANLFLNSNEGYLELKTANAAVFEFNTASWEKVSRKNGELIDFASGKKLK